MKKVLLILALLLMIFSTSFAGTTYYGFDLETKSINDLTAVLYLSYTAATVTQGGESMYFKYSKTLSDGNREYLSEEGWRLIVAKNENFFLVGNTPTPYIFVNSPNFGKGDVQQQSPVIQTPVPQFTQRGQYNPPCSSCNGTGKCTICKGSGKYMFYHIDKEKPSQCAYCHGSGNCPACRGSGKTYGNWFKY